MHPADLQAALKKSGLSQRQIASEAGVSEATVCKVVNKKMPSDQVIEIIAVKLDKKPCDIFPEFFEKPRRGRGRPPLQKQLSK